MTFFLRGIVAGGETTLGSVSLDPPTLRGSAGRVRGEAGGSGRGGWKGDAFRREKNSVVGASLATDEELSYRWREASASSSIEIGRVGRVSFVSLVTDMRRDSCAGESGTRIEPR